MSLCLKIWFSNPNIFATLCRSPEIFQIMNYVGSNNIRFKYWIQSIFKAIGILKSLFVEKTQFLYFSCVFSLKQCFFTNVLRRYKDKKIWDFGKKYLTWKCCFLVSIVFETVLPYCDIEILLLRNLSSHWNSIQTRGLMRFKYLYFAYKEFCCFTF